MFVYVRERNMGAWHYALAREIRPVCTCPCKSAGMTRKLGDTLCKCPCHKLGTKFTASLCGNTPITRWDGVRTSVTGRVTICQACHVIACRVTSPVTKI